MSIVAAVVFTDISPRRHASGAEPGGDPGPGRGGLHPVIASGGVSTLKDIENLMAIEQYGVTGVITGKAVYTGAIRLAEAIQLTKGV